MSIKISITNKIASLVDEEAFIVCGNSDYTIEFAFTDEWSEYSDKTARFIYNGKHIDVTFNGNSCEAPIIANAREVLVGVIAGELSTTTPARIECKKSVACDDIAGTKTEGTIAINSSHTHDNKKTLDDFYCPASEQNNGGLPIMPDVVGIDRVSFKGNELRYSNDGAVVSRVEEVETDGVKFLRLTLAKASLDTNFDVPEFIDIPVERLIEKEIENNSGGLIIGNSSGLELELPTGGTGGTGLTDEQAADLTANTAARHTHDNEEVLDLFEAFDGGDGYAMPYFDGHPILTNSHGGVITSITQNNVTGETKINFRKYADFTKPVEEYTITTPKKISQLENDSGFITKADIPTNESYELIGQTPLTLENGGNIKLVADGEATYRLQTPTIGDIQNADYNTVKATITESDGVYTITSDESITGWYQGYIIFTVPNFVIGETYQVNIDLTGLTQGENEAFCTCAVRAPISNTQITSSGETVYGKLKTFSFTATEETIEFRIYPCHANALTAGKYTSRFKDFYINIGNATTNEHTEICSNSGTFADIVDIEAIPKNATITTEPTAEVYIKKANTEIENIKTMLPLYGKTIVNFGDSIFGNQQPPNDISTFLANKTGATVYNCGFGGCRMSVHPTAEYNAFCMYNLAEAITTRDFTLQNEAVASGNLAERYSTGLERLKNIDFSKVDIVTIAYGTNDYAGIPLENEDNPLDTSKFAGALRYSIETLLTDYPNLRIFVLSAAYRFWVDENNEYTEDSNTRVNSIGLKLSDYNAKLKEVAEEYNLPYVDDYNIGIGKFNRYQYFNANDGAHHKETGRKLIAEQLAKQLY